MPNFSDPSILVAAGIALLIGFLLAVLLLRRTRAPSRSSDSNADAEAVASAIRDYFHKSGVSVRCAATRLAASTSFTAMVESEPMKRFRLSHIVEKSLAEHVRKTCDLELEKVYWRFPIKTTPQQPAADKDDYINEGLMNLKDLSKYELSEGSIELFEATQRHPGKD
jgi:hypothetical protein